MLLLRVERSVDAVDASRCVWGCLVCPCARYVACAMSAAGGGQPPRTKGQAGGFEQRMAKGPDGEELVLWRLWADSAQSYRRAVLVSA